MGFLGCCGAWKESPWMLGTFFTFLPIVLFAEISVGIMVYFQGKPYEDFITEGVKQTVQFNENNFQGEDLGITTTKSYYNVPKSCCRAPETADCFNNLKLDNNQIPSEARLYKAGCGAALTAVISQHLVYLLGAGAALLVMEIFGMLCSLWLCCAVKRIEDMKA